MREGSIQKRHLRTCPRDESGQLKPHRCRGNWGYVLENGRRPDGTRRQISKAGFASKSEATAALNEVLARQKAGLADIRRLTVSQYLRDWLASKRNLRDSTLRNYTGHLDRYVEPGLGDIKLADLRPHHIDQMYTEILGRRLGSGSKATVHDVHRTLRSALNSAVKRRIIPWNPALHVELPPRRRPATQVWTPQDAARFLEASKDDRLSSLFHLILFTGLRRGEAIGLHWTHVDTDLLHVVIEWQVTASSDGPRLGEPKTRAGSRIVPIDRGTATVLGRRHAAQIEERLAWGEGWEDNGLVFTHENGGMIAPDHVHQDVSAPGPQGGRAPNSSTRSAPHACQPGPGCRRRAEGGQRPARALDDVDHVRSLHPCDPGRRASGCRADRRVHPDSRGTRS